MTKLSYDRASQCWREDSNGKCEGIWDEKLGWVCKRIATEE